MTSKPEASCLSEKETEALEKILRMIVPSRIEVKASDVLEGYSKERMIRRILEEAKASPMASIQLRNIYTVLRQIYREPELIKVEVVPFIIGGAHVES